jgi:hypothetical protein
MNLPFTWNNAHPFDLKWAITLFHFPLSKLSVR